MGTRKLISKAVNAVATDYIGEDGELWVDTVSNLMKISDGTTAGGVAIGGGGGGGATTWAAITDINNANGPGKVAIGRNAGSVNQGTETVAIGDDAGKTNQGDNSYALGNNAGATDQGASSVAIGDVAASANQGTLSVAIGANAGTTTQGQQAVAIGGGAGFTNQSAKAVAVGFAAGVTNQGEDSVALGYEAGEVTQGTKAVAIGYRAGETTQGNSTVAIGDSAGETTQSQHGVAIGALAGQTTQGESSVAIGKNAGKVNQGSSAIAIGNLAGVNNQHNNSIVIAASGSELETAQTGQFMVKPVRNASGTHSMEYNPATGEITYDTLASGGLPSRSPPIGATISLADGAEADLNITGFKSYTLMTITTDKAARVRLYVNAATRTADAARAEGIDPTSDAGVIAEVITTGAETVIISPGAIGFNLESSPTTNIPCRVTNKSGSTGTVQVGLNILQLEA